MLQTGEFAARSEELLVGNELKLGEPLEHIVSEGLAQHLDNEMRLGEISHLNVAHLIISRRGIVVVNELMKPALKTGKERKGNKTIRPVQSLEGTTALVSSAPTRLPLVSSEAQACMAARRTV